MVVWCLVVWCLVDLPTSVNNGLGVYDGLSGVLNHVTTWGLPYFLGRLYFSEPSGLRILAIAIFIGGLIYVPLCLWEIRMSPNLHHWVYGFHPHRFAQTIRLGGYRPMVFMKNGLMVAMWMAAASVTGFWLWRIGRLKGLWGVPMGVLVGALVVTTVLCKTVGAQALLVTGIGVVLLTKWTRSRLPLLALLAVPLIYVGLRSTQAWSGRDLVQLVRKYVGEERARSYEGRLEQEDLFSAKAWKRPVLGWGGFRRMRPTDEHTGKDLTRGIDGLWIIILGGNGLVGLLSWIAAMLVAPMLLLWRCPFTHWMHLPVVAPPALALIVVLYTVDCLANGLINPLFLLTIGGLAGFVSKPTSYQAQTSMQPSIVRICRQEAVEN